MRTITKEVFTSDELSDEAKEAALEWARDNLGGIYCWNEENKQSIEAFCQNWGVELRQYSVSPYDPYYYQTDANNGHFRDVKLKSINKEDMLTGYCLDSVLMHAFYDSFKKTGDALYAFNEALDAGFVAWRQDWENAYSDEALGEFLESNGFEFTIDGQEWSE